MAQAMGQAGLADEMARLQQRPALGPSRSAVGRPAADGRRAGARLRRRHRRARRARRPRPARRAARPGLPRRQPRRHRRGADRARARPRRRRRHGPAAPHRARAARAGLRAARRRRPAAHPARAAPARQHRAAPGVRRWSSRAGRGGHDVRDAGAAGEVTGASREWRFGDEQPLDVVRTVRNAVLRSPATAGSQLCGRGLRGGRDRAPLVGRGRAARRHVVLDGAARHLGRGEDDGAGAALAGHHEVPAGRDRDHRLQRLRAGAVPRRARRARLGPRAGHQPAARADAGPPASSTSTAAPSRSSW